MQSQSNQSNPDQAQLEQQRKLQEERQKLVVHVVKLPNGATFTRLKPVVAS